MMILETTVTTVNPRVLQSGIEAVRQPPLGSAGWSHGPERPAEASTPEGGRSIQRAQSRPAFITIGAYGWDAERFFAALTAAGVDTFCDLRARRGVRGRDYAFANSQRLQARLAELGIRYVHRPDLAPGAATRAAQFAADKAEHTAKRQRSVLSQAFVDAYGRQRLDGFDSRAFLTDLGPEARVIALFCVERTPEACHRGLLAERLARDLDINVHHLLP